METIGYTKKNEVSMFRSFLQVKYKCALMRVIDNVEGDAR